MKIAMIGSAHWHTPIYLKATLELGHEVVLFDPDTEKAAGQTRHHKVTSARTLTGLFSSDIDFAIVLGKHTEMPNFIDQTIDADVPFVAEKPAGLQAADVRRLADRCAKAGLFNAAAFSMRWDSAMIRIKRLIESGRLGRIARIGVSYFAGPKSRYPAYGCPWVLDRAISGGGALINVGTHVIDLIRFWGFSPRYVAGSATWELTRGDTEDTATLLLQSGQTTCVVESGYLSINPYAGADLSIFAEHANLEYRRHILTVQWENGEEDRFDNPQPEPRGKMLADLFQRAQSGEPPPVTLYDMAAMLEICNAFYIDIDRREE
jgi:predicted dehydrogenase